MAKEDLIPFNEMPKEKHIELSKKGGIASGIARQKRKSLKDELLALLSENEVQKQMSLKIINEALQGNTKAFEIIRDTIGEKPTDKIEAEVVSYESALKQMSDEDEY